MIGLAAEYTNTPTANNTTFQLDFPFDWRQDLVASTTGASTAKAFYVRYLHDNYDLIEPRGTFIGADCRRSRPTACGRATACRPRTPGSPGEPVQRLQGDGVVERPADSAGRRELDARDLRLPVPPGLRSRPLRREGIPRVTFAGTGAPAQIVGPSASLLSPTTDFTFTNNLTWIKGAHTVRSGVIITRNRKDQNGRNEHTGTSTSIRPATRTRRATRSRTRCSATSAPTPRGATIRSGSSASPSTAATSRTTGVCTRT